MQKHYKPLLLSLFSGVLLTAGWPVAGFAPVLFIGFVPLLYAEDIVSTSGEYKNTNIFLYSYLSFFTWNLLTTWWIKNASLGGAAMAILANSLLMSLVFFFFHLTKKRIKGKSRFLIFPAFWISFEFFHLDWDLTFPWLTLGNGLAEMPHFIQWYEYTGVFGGSLWIIIANILVFKIIKNWKDSNAPKRIRNFSWLALWLLIPVLISSLIYSNYMETGEKKNVVIVQPNVDPYLKFNGSFNEELVSMMRLANEKVDNKTDYVVFPETALTENMWEEEIANCYSIEFLREFVKRFPSLNVVTGASTFKKYEKGEKHPLSSRKFKNGDGFYDAFNTALQINNQSEIAIYHKSKLVPGVEKMPFPALFRPLENLAIDLGGTSGSLGTQEDRTPFISVDGQSKIAPVICYESIYGEYVTGYIKNGAQCIFIITNDGWWGDTPGYKQHLMYGTLRAIETRKEIVRSANTGISCIVDQLGNIHQPLKWWVEGTIKTEVRFNSVLTFYTRFGDLIARFCFVGALAFILSALVLKVRIGKKL